MTQDTAAFIAFLAFFAGMLFMGALLDYFEDGSLYYAELTLCAVFIAIVIWLIKS